MRLIDADALIALVQNSTILGDGFKQAFCALVNGEPTVKPDRKTGGWIPCSERLPKIDELVLVTDDSGGIKTVDVDRCGQYECSEKRFWYYTQNVVAWMSLPEPYEGEK